MKSLKISLLFFVLSAVTLAFSQVTAGVSAPTYSCDNLLSDAAGVISNPTQVINAEKQLEAQGAVVRVATVILGNYPNLDTWANSFVKNCPLLQSIPATASRPAVARSNIMIVALAPAGKQISSYQGKSQIGIYAGTAYEKTFAGGRLDKYKIDFMVPRFVKGEYADGFAAGLEQMAARIAASRSEANSPTVTNITHEAEKPADLHGFWVFLWCLAGLVFLAFVYFFIERRRLDKEDCEEAQQKAIAARGRASDRIDEVTTKLAAYNNDFSKAPGAARASAMLDQVSRSFSEMASNLSTDPTQKGLEASTYNSINSEYTILETKLNLAIAWIKDPTVLQSTPIPTEPISTEKKEWPHKSSHKHSHSPHDSARVPRAQPEYRDNSVESFAAGALMGSMLGHPGYTETAPYREPAYVAPEPEPEPEPSFTSESSSSDFGSSNDDTSSSDTSFSSSSSSSSFDDSPSSSFSDSSSSSSFDSSSSSSSDFSSGSGSSDF